jgi:hypothetical protein
MILNTRIWQETINAAKSAASTSPAWLRAIDRAVIEIERSRYWSFADGVLTIISTTSKKTYRIDEKHTCEACSNGHRECKHRAARRLMLRYTERLMNAFPVVRQTVEEQIERDRLIAGIRAEWKKRHPRNPLGLALLERFGTNRLERLATDFLRRIQVALA